MDDITKRATVTVVDGKYTDRYELGKVDTTHFFMLLTQTAKEKTVITHYDKPTEDEVRNGAVFHVGQLRGARLEPLYQPIWDWLRGIKDVNGLVFTL